MSLKYTTRERRRKPLITPLTAEINKVCRSPWDYGDRELAFQVLGMRPANNEDYHLPTVDGFLIHVNSILGRIHPLVVSEIFKQNRKIYPLCRQHGILLRARSACQKIRMAIGTIAGLQNENWADYSSSTSLTVNLGDLRPGANWNKTNPMSANMFTDHKSRLEPTKTRKQRYFSSRPKSETPTANEVMHANEERLRASANDFLMDPPLCRNRATEDPEIVIREFKVPGDGNCYWYALSEALNGEGKWNKFAEIKANIRKYFMDVLNSPRHPRFRMYWLLEEGSKCQTHRHGELSLSRCLHTCSKNAGAARHRPQTFGHELALNQIIADYYDVEVLEYEEYMDVEKGSQCSDLEDEDNEIPLKRPRCRGIEGAKQIIILKDWSHFTAGHSSRRIDTSWVTPWERIDHFPWHPNKRTEMTSLDLPLRLSSDLRYENPANRASESEINHVKANRDIEIIMPSLESFD